MPKLSKSSQLLRAKKLMEDFAKADGNRKKVAKMRNTTPGNIGRELRKPYVQEFIQKTMSQHLDEAGVTDPKIAQKISKLMNAQGIIVTKSGEVISNPDNSTQVRATELALKVKKHIGAEPINVNVNVGIAAFIKKGRDRINGKVIDTSAS